MRCDENGNLCSENENSICNPDEAKMDSTSNTQNPPLYDEQHTAYSKNSPPIANCKTSNICRKNKMVMAVCIISAVIFGTLAVSICGTILYKYFFQNGGALTSYPNEYVPGAYAKSQKIQSSDNENFSSQVLSEVSETGTNSLTVEEIATKVTPSIVGVVAENYLLGTDSSNTGSGIIVSDDGYIVTNYHVIENGNNITVVLDSGDDYASSVIGYDAKTDIAVLKIEASNLPAAELGNSDNLRQGALAVAIGNPMGLELQGTVTQGCISAINRNVSVGNNSMTLIQTDASINPGNSGGALVDKYGQVVGINSVKLGISYYEGLGFAIPINTVKPIIDELIAYGYIKGRPSIGISGKDISGRAANYYGIAQGVLVDYVYQLSNAAANGLAVGDIITHVNGQRVYTMDEISTIQDKFKAGDMFSVTVYRDGKSIDISFLLMDQSNIVRS